MKHLVFVYGTLKKGFSNNSFLEDSVCYGKAYTSKRFLLIKDIGLPFVVKDFKHSYSTNIKGEVYLIDDFTLNDLDYLESHPYFYRREQITVYVKGIPLKCWCYFLNADYVKTDNIIIDGEWK
jgi:gamma-glutamylaminecyclotransferase